MAMALFKSKEQECIDLLRAKHEERSQIAAEILAKQSELAELTAGRTDAAALSARRKGEVAIGGVVAASVVERQLADLFGSRRELIREWKDARLDLGQIRATAFNKDADKPQAKLDRHNSRTAELLAALQDHTGRPFVVDVMTDRDIFYDKNGRETIFSRGNSSVPPDVQLQREIEILRGQAARANAEAAAACLGGSIAAEDDLETLLAVAEDCTQLAPLKPEIEAWHARETARLDAEWQAFLDTPGLFSDQRYVIIKPERVRKFTMHWNSQGELDEAKSSSANIRFDPDPPARPARPPVPEGLEYPALR